MKAIYLDKAHELTLEARSLESEADSLEAIIDNDDQSVVLVGKTTRREDYSVVQVRLSAGEYFESDCDDQPWRKVG